MTSLLRQLLAHVITKLIGRTPTEGTIVVGNWIPDSGLVVTGLLHINPRSHARMHTHTHTHTHSLMQKHTHLHTPTRAHDIIIIAKVGIPSHYRKIQLPEESSRLSLDPDRSGPYPCIIRISSASNTEDNIHVSSGLIQYSSRPLKSRSRLNLILFSKYSGSVRVAPGRTQSGPRVAFEWPPKQRQKVDEHGQI